MPYNNPKYPNSLWDGSTKNPNRVDLNSNVDPNADDWERIAAEVMALQSHTDGVLLPLINNDGEVTITDDNGEVQPLTTSATIYIDASSGAKAIDLPPPAQLPDATLLIKKVDNTENVVTLTPLAGTIDAFASVELIKPFQYLRLKSDGTTYRITGGLNTSELSLARDYNQGFYGLLTNFYYTGGLATDTVVAVEDVDTWIDVNLTVDALGQFDNRPAPMQSAQASGHTGAGTQADPIVFLLEGLEQTSSANFRAAMTFTPDEDGGRLDSRILFNRHSGTTPSDDFAIEATSVAMESGADEAYANTANLQFFVGDTIDTNGAGDAGKVRFQIKSDVAGTLSMREIALFIQL